MKKICTVVGARPQFIKLAVVSRELRKTNEEVIIHTGQHFDYNMSEVFFQEMGIPTPDYNLGISGGSHAEMTGNMLIGIEKVLVDECPDLLLVFGDTNSTLAASLAAVKLHIPVCHVEAGNRLHALENPEEVNRVVTDHISSLCLACTESGLENLKTEGLGDRSFLVGDPMYDAFLYYSQKANTLENGQIIGIAGDKVTIPQEYYYLTCHRQENTDSDTKLKEIFDAMECLDAKVIYPVHPRNVRRATSLLEEYKYKNILLTEPVGYLASLYLVNNAKKIVTDSGGLQREAFFAKKPCVTIFDWVGWPETMRNNCNQLSKPEKQDILAKLNMDVYFENDYMPFGDGHSGKTIASIIGDYK